MAQAFAKRTALCLKRGDGHKSYSGDVVSEYNKNSLHVEHVPKNWSKIWKIWKDTTSNMERNRDQKPGLTV